MMPVIEKLNRLTYEQDQKVWLTDLIRYLRRHDSTPGTFIDIGANHGGLSDAIISAQDDQDYQLICIEPHTQLFADLCQKFRHNQRVKLIDMLASDQTGQVLDFHETDHGFSYVHFSPVDFSGICKVVQKSTICVDDLLSDAAYRCKFIKIDAEGHDFKILTGSTNTLSSQRPIVLFEFSGMMACKAYGFTPADWYGFFQDIRYKLLCPIGPKNEKFILQNFNKLMPEFVDLLAVPEELYPSLTT